MPSRPWTTRQPSLLAFLAHPARLTSQPPILLASPAAVRSEDVQAELDELCELWGVEKRDVADNERSNDRDKRAKQLRDLFVKRKAERLKALEALGHARVVAAAGQPGALRLSPMASSAAAACATPQRLGPPLPRLPCA